MNPLRYLTRVLRSKSDLQEELESHLNMAIADRLARGESPTRARREALREFGNAALIADVTREHWGWVRLEHIVQDTRYAARQLRKTPAFTVSALLTLMLAIGANTAIFSLAYALLLKNLPVAQPEKLVQVQLNMRAQAGQGKWAPTPNLSGGFFDVVAAEQKVFSGVCGWDIVHLNLSEQDHTQSLRADEITGDCFRTLGVKPALGRLFTASEDRAGGGAQGYPIVLSYDFWQAQFGGDPKVLGRHLSFQGTPGVVIGVAPRGFRGITVGNDPQVFAPSEIGDHEERHHFGSFNRVIVGRLKDGVSLAQATAQLDLAYNAWIDANRPEWRKNATDFNGIYAEQRVRLTPARTGYSYLRESYQRPLLILQILVALCLLIACAYLATMFSARALNRRHELALRSALGASRSRIARQLLSECLLLASGGAALGILFAWCSGRWTLLLINGFGTPQYLDLSPRLEVLVFTAGLTLLTVMLFGVGPALRASRISPANDIQQGRQSLMATLRAGHLSRWLMPVQIAMSLVIVTAAMLLSSSLVKLLSQELGFRVSNVTFVGTDFSYRGKQIKDLTPLYGSILERLNHAPGIDSASLSVTHQLSGAMYLQKVIRTLPSGQMRTDEMMALTMAPRYLETTGTRLIAGREFTEADDQTAQEVCILNQTAAHYLFPDGSAIGGTIQMEHPVQVVGIAEDTKNTSLRENTANMVYLPILQRSFNPFPEIAIKSSNRALALGGLHSIFQQLAPDVPLYEPLTMQEALNGAASQERLLAILGDFLALLALVLTAIGVYGLMNSEVSWRRTEIGIRMALGASRGQVMTMIMRKVTLLIFPGIIIGMLGAAALSRVFRSFLYQTSSMDPTAFSLGLGTLLAVAVIAALLPARKAASIQPMEALRAE
jgi:predicted permease